MSASVATKLVEVYSVLQAPASRLKRRVARFVSDGRDVNPLAAVLEHLRHEWEFLESAIAIEGLQNFVATTHFD
jgi:hypothetical protein